MGNGFSEMKTNFILNGHVLEMLDMIPDESINCCVTSPPYWGLRSYNTKDEVWGGDEKCVPEWGVANKKSINLQAGNPEFKRKWRELATDKESSTGKFCQKCDAWRGSLGLEPTFELYIKHLCDIFDEIKRVLMKNGTCFVNIGDSYSGSGKGIGTDRTACKEAYTDDDINKTNWKKTGVLVKSLCQIPSRFAIAMTDRGWILRNEIIWYKRNCMPSSVKDRFRFTVDFEKIFFFTKNKKYWFDQQFENLAESTQNDYRVANSDYTENRPERDYIGVAQQGSGMLKPSMYGRNKRCVWDINPKPFKEAHFAVFPPKLVETPIRAGCPLEGIVLDPFMGSGTVAIMAENLGRKWLVIELNADYVEIANKRIEENRSGLFPLE